MPEPIILPRYRCRLRPPTQFFNAPEGVNLAFALADLARSNLTLADLEAQAPDNLDIPEGATAGYVIPYFSPQRTILTREDRTPSMCRTRLQYPEWSKAQRYTQPSAADLATLGLPSILPYLYPLPEHLPTDTVAIVEGEKKTAAVVKYLQLAALGIGGDQNWRHPNGKGGVHPWIVDYLRTLGTKSVLIIPDADIFRYDICAAYGALAFRLTELGFAVEVIQPPLKIDDWIVQGGARSAFDALPRIDTSKLVRTPGSLVEQCELAFKRSDKGIVTVPCHTSNLERLIERSGAFPRLWKNVEDGKVYLGAAPAMIDTTEVEITNHMQHYMGMGDAKVGPVKQVLAMLANRNAQSPMLEQLRRSHWDSVPRLDSWAITYWGCDDNSYIRCAMSRWLIASCARLNEPGVKFDWALVTIGPAGTGKTMMPSVFWGERSLTLLGSPKDTDLYMLLHSALCVGFDELDILTHWESKHLLGLITRQIDPFRAPYAASVDFHPRRCVFYGSGNKPAFLQKGDAYARRFAVIEVPQLLDFKRLTPEVPQIWAEAWHRYQHGENWWDVPMMTADQRERYTVPDAEEENIRAWIEQQRELKYKEKPTNEGYYFTMAMLLGGLNYPASAGNSGTTRRLAGILDDLKIEQRQTSINSVKGRWYYVPKGREI